jgi:hypothetical protein
LPDKAHNLKKDHVDLKSVGGHFCKDNEDLILAMLREVLKHESLAKFAIDHYDEFADKLNCRIQIYGSSLCSG